MVLSQRLKVTRSVPVDFRYLNTIFSIKKTKNDTAIPARRNRKGPVRSLKERTLFSSAASCSYQVNTDPV